MQAAVFPPVLLFVAGAPDPGELRPPIAGAWGRMLMPASMVLSAGPPPSTPPPGAWHLPREMEMAVEVVMKEADRRQIPVRVVDVNRPGEDRPLVERYITPDDLLPLLVRSDNTRLEGFEQFTPAEIRQFLGHH